VGKGNKKPAQGQPCAGFLFSNGETKTMKTITKQTISERFNISVKSIACYDAGCQVVGDKRDKTLFYVVDGGKVKDEFHIAKQEYFINYKMFQNCGIEKTFNRFDATRSGFIFERVVNGESLIGIGNPIPTFEKGDRVFIGGDVGEVVGVDVYSVTSRPFFSRKHFLHSYVTWDTYYQVVRNGQTIPEFFRDCELNAV
jgi:hypothetical protein